MIVYEATKELFVEDVVQDRIEENIDSKFYEKMGYKQISDIFLDAGVDHITMMKMI